MATRSSSAGYLRLLEREGARVLFAPQKPLARLMRTLSPTVAIVDADDPSLEFDFHCPLMSLPLAFHTTLATIPASVPYLDAEPERLAAWRERLGGDGFKIGVAWRGSALGQQRRPFRAAQRICQTRGAGRAPHFPA